MQGMRVGGGRGKWECEPGRGRTTGEIGVHASGEGSFAFSARRAGRRERRPDLCTGDEVQMQGEKSG
jgi:hypothetical protein